MAAAIPSYVGLGSLLFLRSFITANVAHGGIGLRAPWANGFAVSGLAGSAATAPTAAASAGAAAAAGNAMRALKNRVDLNGLVLRRATRSDRKSSLGRLVFTTSPDPTRAGGYGVASD